MYWDDIYDDFIASEVFTGLPEGERSMATANIPAPPEQIYTTTPYQGPSWMDQPSRSVPQPSYYPPPGFPDPDFQRPITDLQVPTVPVPGDINYRSDPGDELTFHNIPGAPIPFDVVAGSVGTGVRGGLLMGTMLGVGVRGIAGPIIKNAWGLGLKGISKIPGTNTLKQGIIGIAGFAAIGILVDQVFDGDEQMLDRMLGFIEQGIAEGSILWPTFRRGDNAGEQIPPNYLTFDLNKGTGWIHQEHISKNFVNAVRRNERTPRYKSTPSPKRRR